MVSGAALYGCDYIILCLLFTFFLCDIVIFLDELGRIMLYILLD